MPCRLTMIKYHKNNNSNKSRTIKMMLVLVLLHQHSVVDRLYLKLSNKKPSLNSQPNQIKNSYLPTNYTINNYNNSNNNSNRVYSNNCNSNNINNSSNSLLHDFKIVIMLQVFKMLTIMGVRILVSTLVVSIIIAIHRQMCQVQLS